MDIQRLPPSLAGVLAVIGEQATLKLIDVKGGTRIYPPDPARLGPDHEWAQWMDLDKAKALAGYLRSLPNDDQWRVPLAKPVVMEIAILRMTDDGMSAAEIARELKCTDKTVYEVRGKRRKAWEIKQPDLFESPDPGVKQDG